MDRSDPLPAAPAAPILASSPLAPPVHARSATALVPEACHQFARRMHRLYSLPAAALEVIRLTSSNDADVRALTETLEADPALAARILAVVNSSVYALREKVLDVNQAVTLLGLKPLKLLVLGISLPKELLSLDDSTVLSSYWRHALVKSVAAREISRRFFQRRCEDEAFIAGLLQDLGLLALVQHLGSPFVRLLQLVQQQRAELSAAEEEALGFDHVALTAAMLAEWGLPATLVEYVRHRASDASRPNDSATALVAQILHMAELCARILSERPECLASLQSFARATCGADEAAVGQLLYELGGKVTPLATALAIDTHEWPELRGLVDAAYAALARAGGIASHDPIDQETLREVAECARTFDRQRPQRRTAAPSEKPAAARSRLPQAATRITADVSFSGGDLELRQQITAAANWCRAQRCPLSLILIELIDFEELLITHGPAHAREVAALLRPAIEGAAEGRFTIVPLSAAQLALVICDCDRQQALGLARQVLDHATAELTRSARALAGALRQGLCLGVATLPMALRNFAAENLEAAARRCLFAARQSGGGMVKSIDLI